MSIRNLSPAIIFVWLGVLASVSAFGRDLAAECLGRDIPHNERIPACLVEVQDYSVVADRSSRSDNTLGELLAGLALGRYESGQVEDARADLHVLKTVESSFSKLAEFSQSTFISAARDSGVFLLAVRQSLRVAEDPSAWPHRFADLVVVSVRSLVGAGLLQQAEQMLDHAETKNVRSQDEQIKLAVAQSILLIARNRVAEAHDLLSPWTTTAKDPEFFRVQSILYRVKDQAVEAVVAAEQAIALAKKKQSIPAEIDARITLFQALLGSVETPYKMALAFQEARIIKDLVAHSQVHPTFVALVMDRAARIAALHGRDEQALEFYVMASQSGYWASFHYAFDLTVSRHMDSLDLDTNAEVLRECFPQGCRPAPLPECIPFQDELPEAGSPECFRPVY